MDKSWIKLPRCEKLYYEGIDSFVEFVKQNKAELTYPCPCRKCKLHKGGTTSKEMHRHLILYGMMSEYTTWTLHGEFEHHHLQNDEGTSSDQSGGLHNMNPTMELLHNTFPFGDRYGTSENDTINDCVQYDYLRKDAYEKYCRLVAEAQRPLYSGSTQTILECILKAMQVKIEGRWSDKSFNKHLELVKDILPKDNIYPEPYRDVKKILMNLGLSYEIIHACEYGCVLYYKEYIDFEYCPICHEPRYVNNEGGSKVPKKTVRYFPITPRLQRLYMSPYIAKEMRWHVERRATEGDTDLIHPVDGEAWHNFNKDFPSFANEIRNVPLGLSNDGFNPFDVSGLSHSTWPILVMPYNLPPWMCMKKEFNILAMLISGPNSPGKCLNVFMRPLIDELKILWNTGVVTFDRHSGSSFLMKVAVMWTLVTSQA
ncbi:unnamed protein product [Rhodiola kirilowii]